MRPTNGNLVGSVRTCPYFFVSAGIDTATGIDTGADSVPEPTLITLGIALASVPKKL